MTQPADIEMQQAPLILSAGWREWQQQL